MGIDLDILKDIYGVVELNFIAALILGLAFGFVIERTRYCLRSALLETITKSPSSEQKHEKGGKVRSIQYLSAILIAVIGTQLLHFTGYIDLSASIYWATPIVL